MSRFFIAFNYISSFFSFLSFLFKKHFEMSLIDIIVSEEDIIYEEDFNEEVYKYL